MQLLRGVTVRGIPVLKPPYGTLTAIDLDSGEHRWQVAIGDQPAIRNHALLAGVELPPLGRMGNAGPLVTAGRLVFLSGYNPQLFAVDSETGETLWQGELLGNEGTANPMTYPDQRRQTVHRDRCHGVGVVPGPDRVRPAGRVT